MNASWIDDAISLNEDIHVNFSRCRHQLDSLRHCFGMRTASIWRQSGVADVN